MTDNRRTPEQERKDIAIPVRMDVIRPGGVKTVEYAVNLSVGGCCMQTSEPMESNAKLQANFKLPGEDQVITTEATVVWVTTETDAQDKIIYCEMGIRFEGMSHRDRQRILHYVQNYEEPETP